MDTQPKRGRAARRNLTPDEQRFIRDNEGKLSLQDLAQHLGLTVYGLRIIAGRQMHVELRSHSQSVYELISGEV